jgi:hypothetical protein
MVVEMEGISPPWFTGVVAVAGLAVGGLGGCAMVHLSQRRQFLATRVLRELDEREQVYARFIEQASEMWLDAFESPHDPANLIGLSALIGRIRLASSRRVLEAAEAVMDFLLDTCERRPLDVRKLIAEAPREFVAPLAAFTGACRAEREQMLRSL